MGSVLRLLSTWMLLERPWVNQAACIRPLQPTKNCVGGSLYSTLMSLYKRLLIYPSQPFYLLHGSFL